MKVLVVFSLFIIGENNVKIKTVYSQAVVDLGAKITQLLLRTHSIQLSKQLPYCVSDIGIISRNSGGSHGSSNLGYIRDLNTCMLTQTILIASIFLKLIFINLIQITILHMNLKCSGS